jgi:PAS domain S-box-containing protein
MYNNEDFRSLVMLAGVGIVRVDAEGVIRFSNPCMLRMLGYDAEEELVGRELLDIVEASDRGGVIEKFRMMKRRLTEVSMVWFARKDGSSFIGRLSRIPLFRRGAFSGAFAVVMDMTTEVRMVERLKANEARFRNLANQLPAAVCELAPDSSIRYCNNFARRLLSLDARGERPKLRSFVAEDELVRYDQMVGTIFEGREVEPFAMDLVLSPSRRLPTLWSLALERWRGKSPRASVVMIEVESLISSTFFCSEEFFSSYGLTDRERSVARRLVSGSIYKEIAFELGISLSTVRTHTMSLYRKMAIHSRAELIDMAYSWQAEHIGIRALPRMLWPEKPLVQSAE